MPAVHIVRRRNSPHEAPRRPLVELATVEGPATASGADQVPLREPQFIGDVDNLCVLITSECTTGLKAV
jgi:hypothetical protein